MQVFAQGKARPVVNGIKPKLSPQHRAFVKQMVRIMKLTAILLTMAFLQVSATGFSQPGTVTFSGKEISLEKVFSVIKKQTGYSFFYYAEQLQQAKKVTINVKNATVEDVLIMCLKDQPFDYSIKGKTIFIIQKQDKAIPESKQVQAEDPGTPEVKGRITNTSGEPLSGANVVVKRTGKGTQANANGEFILKNINIDDVLTISYTGYQPISIKVGDRSNLTLIMNLATNELDETIVQAYGTTTRRLATGNIVRVSAEEIEKQPVMNPLLALQGRVAGLNITQTSGFVSAPVKVELRGRNIINDKFTSDPLYIIDGVPLTINEIGKTSSYATGSSGFLQTGYGGPANGQSPLFSINPADIESIEVLKDADATAIYGSRGANGVILITTKKGKAGKTKLDLTIQQGITKVTRYWKMMNTQQYIQMRKEAYYNDGITPTVSNGGYDLLLWDTTRYVDWQKELYGGLGKSFTVQAGLSGGDSRTNFRLGTGYNRTSNIITVDGADQRASLSFSIGHRSLDQKFSVLLTANYSYTQSDMTNFPESAARLPPNAPSIYDSDGNLNFSGWGIPNSPGRSSYTFDVLKQPYLAKTNFLNSSLTLNYYIVRGMQASVNFGYNNSQADNQNLRLITSKDPANNPKGEAVFGYNNNKIWIIEPQFNYAFSIGKGKLNMLIGSSLQMTKTASLRVTGSQYTSDDVIGSISSAPIQTTVDGYGEYKYAAVFGRIIYNWDNKYILSLNARRDGSSRFGEDKQFGNFGSVGIAWIFSEEKYFKRYLQFISFGKLRGSIGTTGSDAVGDYQYLTQWSSSSTPVYNGLSTLTPMLHANPEFQWQVNKKLEGAIDIGLFKDKINISIAYYRNRCGNQLISFPTPAMSGFTSVTANSPALVQNDGWEVVLGATVIDKKDFRFGLTFNTGINRNKLLAYPNIELSPFASKLKVGQPLNMVYLLHFTGVDPQTGEYTVEDKNEDGNFTFSPGKPNDDSYVRILSPKFIGGLGTNFKYRDFNLSLFFNIKKQIGKNAIKLSSNVGAIGNQPMELIGKQWQKTGDIATYARFTTKSNQGTALYNFSDGLYTDASFIRLSTLSLSYSLPILWIKKAGVKGCSLFANAHNLFVLTNYKGLDPETQNFGGMPPSKTIVGGININF
jgi:TonB-linked SusC/RagA family outer membrane protein